MATTKRGDGAYHNIMAELYATDIPGFTNFMSMTPKFFEMIKTTLEPRLARQATNYRAPISVGEKFALTIRYLATGESYTSLSCQFRVGRSTISKFLPVVCRAIQDEFTREYFRYPTTPDEWKELETEFRIWKRSPWIVERSPCHESPSWQTCGPEETATIRDSFQ